MKRGPVPQVFHSVHRMGEWQVTLDNRAVAAHPSQADSEADAKARALAVHEAGGIGRAVLHRLDGSIRGRAWPRAGHCSSSASEVAPAVRLGVARLLQLFPGPGRRDLAPRPSR